MILEIAIGDAYGAGFEFASREIIEEHNTLQYYLKHPKDDICGKYTDDTQMSLAILKHLMDRRPMSKEAIADSFVWIYKKDPRLGYAKGFQGVLDGVDNGYDLLHVIKPDSVRNGAMMRSVPLCIITNEVDMLQFAAIQASVTHDTPIGILSSQIIAYTAFHLLRGKSLEVIIGEIETRLSFKINTNWTSSVRCDAEDTIHAVFTVLQGARSYSEVLLRSVYLGGDTDSVASIAMGLMSLYSTMKIAKNDKLSNLYHGLENNKFGKDFLETVDGMLDRVFFKPIRREHNCATTR